VSLDQWVAGFLLPLALWILLSGLDDLFITAVFLVRLLRRRTRFDWPSAADLDAAAHRRIAIFVPLWREHAVIGAMLDHNTSVIRYDNYDFFVGVYPNDALTVEAVSVLSDRHPQVHVVVCPHPGPTSKADCLNWIYHGMAAWEREHDARFDVVVTHDAEDLIHPDSLPLIDYFAQRYDMVQIPVLPLAKPTHQWIHGLYCDEFAEYQTKDIPVRHALGGFLPSNGVGAGFSRAVLEEISARCGGRIFDPDCLTEDYENGYRVYRLGRPQIFVPLRRDAVGWTATREYFPHLFRTAVRQRSRWVIGISLQGWERHGWRAAPGQLYWFWRDRKGLAGNLVSPLANCGFLVWAAGWVRSFAKGSPWGLPAAVPPWLQAVCAATFAISLAQMATRGFCSARVYGLRFAAWAPLRALLGNWLNFAATVAALGQYAAARWRGARLRWRKTEHLYPDAALLRRHKPRLGELLVRLRAVSRTDLEDALGSLPRHCRLGEHLLRLHKITHQQMYQALSMQSGLPLAGPRTIPYSIEGTRALPARVVRRWNVMPVGVHGGCLHVGVTDVPSDHLRRDLMRFSSLELRFCLILPEQLEALSGGHLPLEGVRDVLPPARVAGGRTPARPS